MLSSDKIIDIGIFVCFLGVLLNLHKTHKVKANRQKINLIIKKFRDNMVIKFRKNNENKRFFMYFKSIVTNYNLKVLFFFENMNQKTMNVLKFTIFCLIVLSIESLSIKQNHQKVNHDLVEAYVKKTQHKLGSLFNIENSQKEEDR